MIRCLVLVLSIGMLPSVYGQTEINAGDLSGSIYAKGGTPVPPASVTVRDTQRGLIRETSSDKLGIFRVVSLPPGLYELEVSCPGCPRTIIRDIQIRLGETLNLQVELDLNPDIPMQSFAVEVKDKPHVIETYRTQQANSVDEIRLRNLPINRRNYLDFALLFPGIVDSTSLVDDNDFRVAQSPQSGLSIGGNNGRGNAFSIDGISNDYNSGGVRPSISQEAVQEFQINRSSFSAEFGGSIGGAVNIVSRSGANAFYGNAFGLLRQRALQARNYFDTAKSPYTRGQYGATLGGPIQRNKSFFFAAFEQLTQHETVFVPILNSSSAFTSVTPSQQLLLNYFASSGSSDLIKLGQTLNQFLVPNNFPGTRALFENNSGDFPFFGQTTQASLRLDHRFSDKDSVFMRTNFTGASADNTQFGAQIAANRGRSSDQQDATVMASWILIPGPHWLVETRAGFGFDDFYLKPVDPYGPELNINGYGFFGRDIYLPSRDMERLWQFEQNWTRFAGKHVFKFGASFNAIQDAIVTETLLGGQFDFGSVIPLDSLLNSFTGVPTFSTNLAASLAASGNTALVQSINAPISALQAYDLGLPDFYQQGFGSPAWRGWSRRLYTFVQDSWSANSRLKLDFGLRYELELNTGPIHDRKDNFAPRFGFAWSPGGGRTVIRGGYGIYDAPVNAEFPYIAEVFGSQQIYTTLIPLTGFPGAIDPQTGAEPSSADVYRTLLAEGILGSRTILPSDLFQFGLHPSPGLPLGARFLVDATFRNPYSQQGSFEIEHALGDWSVSASYNFNRALHIARAIDSNIILAGLHPDGTPIYGFRDPSLIQENLYQSTANSYYNAGILQVGRRFSRFYSFSAHYTWSKTIDDVDDFITDYEPNDQLNARADRGLSAFNQKHRFGANFVLESPAHHGAGFWPAVLHGFVFSGITQANSARPFNILVGFDNVGDNHPTTHRPAGAGRNIGIGPDYFSSDFRLSREFKPLRNERVALLISAEMFNAFNRTNFRAVNNIVGDVTLSQLPHPVTGHTGPATEPLAFTSAFDPRQAQLGLKLSF